MRVIPLVTTDREFHTTIAGLVDAEVHLLDDAGQAIDFLCLEMPELCLLDFGSDIDAFSLLDALLADPWLLHGGIIALTDDPDETDRLQNEARANVVAVVPRSDPAKTLPRVLGIIRDNHRLLYQRAIGSDLVRDIEGHVELTNDPIEAWCYQKLVCNYLHNANRIDTESKAALNLAINEMLMNAIEHGNCGISYDEKTAWIESGRPIEALIAERCRDPEIAGRRVAFDYAITPTCSRFRIADEGAGFDWRNARDPARPENLLETHGRGIRMAESVTSELTYNDKGNEVRFEVPHQIDEASETPSIFEGVLPREVDEGAVIFEQGDPGDSLHYIVKGRYEVVANGEHVATLTPEDLFVGEMSFLLSRERTATVRAITPGRLIRIPRGQLVEAIRARPHYALVLARILAQRLRLMGVR